MIPILVPARLEVHMYAMTSILPPRRPKSDAGLRRPPNSPAVLSFGAVLQEVPAARSNILASVNTLVLDPYMGRVVPGTP